MKIDRYIDVTYIAKELSLLLESIMPNREHVLPLILSKSISKKVIQLYLPRL